MKGLLLKEWYMLKSVGRTHLFIIAAFLAIGSFMPENGFLTYYPCLLAGMMVTTLMAYDEREKWNIYALTLPCTKRQLVTAKYAVSLAFSGAVVLLTLLACMGQMLVAHAFTVGRLGRLLLVLIPLSIIPTACLLPCLFRFGVEKGRVLYYVVLIVSVCAATIGDNLTQQFHLAQGSTVLPNLLLCIASLALYTVSWLLSVRFFTQRETA